MEGLLKSLCSAGGAALRHRIMLALFGCALVMMLAPTPAHAASSGSIYAAFNVDFSDLLQLWAAVKPLLIVLGAIVSFVLFILAIFQAVGKNWTGVITYAIFGFVCLYIVAHAAGWVSSESGQSI